MDNKYLEIAIKAAIEAGQEILKIYKSTNFGVELKADQSPLTIADKAAHLIIEKHLKKTPFPLLSEEGKSIDYNIRKNWKTFWLVDPLDGTKEFINKNGEFTVNIALIENQIPILGVVLIPVTDEIFFASEAGSFKSKIAQEITSVFENAVQLPLVSEHSEFCVVGSRSHLNIETDTYISKLSTNGKPLKMITKGSSLKFCLIAEGEAAIYPRLGPTMEWDTAAGHAIAVFAGKTVTTYPGGEPLIYNKENLLNPHFVVK